MLSPHKPVSSLLRWPSPSQESSDSAISLTVGMRLRSHCNSIIINPFDLSSECSDSDYLESQYTLRSRRVPPSVSSGFASGRLHKRCSGGGDNTNDSLYWSDYSVFSGEPPESSLSPVIASSAISASATASFTQPPAPGLQAAAEYVNSSTSPSLAKNQKMSFNYELRQRNPRSCPPPSPLPLCHTPHSHSHQYSLPQISSGTLAELLRGRYSCYLSDSGTGNSIGSGYSSNSCSNITGGNKCGYTLLDCRFPYEYEGGHVEGARNLFTGCQLMRWLLLQISAATTVATATSTTTEGSNQEQDKTETSELDQLLSLLLGQLQTGTVDYNSHAFVFYCEFSSFRAPKMAQCLRGLDRLANMQTQSRLRVPHIYVLHGGYSEFFSKHPELCMPRRYVPMKQTPYELRSPISSPTGSHWPQDTEYMGTDETMAGCLGQSSDLPVTPAMTAAAVSWRSGFNSPSPQYRKQQISCQHLLKIDTKRLLKLISATTKNADIVRLFRFDEIF